jgi:ubiquinone/menaquinone biosynthesis C-methylase UbiE
MKKKSTGERLEFYDFSDVTVEHLHRYAIANDFVKNKVVLDIASGEGYGSYILSKNASKVIGVDIDKETVFDAQKKYINNNLSFKVGSADKIPVDSNSIDVVVSFETIEHHDKHEEMFLEIKRVLKSDGILIMSSPDKKYYSDIPGFQNKFHIKELYFDEFKNLVNNNFKFSNFLFQKAFNFNSFISNEELFNKMEVFFGDNSLLQKDALEPLYNIAIASNEKFISVSPSLFNGKNISDLQLENILIIKKAIFEDKIYATNSYKVGNFILSPVFFLKKLIKRIN